MSVVEQAVERPGTRGVRTRIRGTVGWDFLGLPAVILVLCAYFGSQSENFLTGSNAQNIGRNIAAIALLAMAQAIVIVIGQIDLSVGAMLGLTSVVVVMAIDEFGALAGFVAGPLVGLAVGLFNGILVITLRVHAVIVTIGTLTAVQGLSLVITNGVPVTTELPRALTLLGDGQVLSVPVPLIAAVIVFVVMVFLFNYTVVGPMLYATGGNEEAARLAGINTLAVKLGAFAMAGLIAGIAGLILTGRIRSGQPTLGEGLELQAVAAAVIGGMALSGGRGRIGGVALGVVLLTVLQNGLDLTNVSSYLQQVIVGVVIFVALASDFLRHRSHDRRAGRPVPPTAAGQAPPGSDPRPQGVS